MKTTQSKATTYRIETVSGMGLPPNVKASGYATVEAAERAADEHHPGSYWLIEEPGAKPVKFGHSQSWR
jgi:hypothetical protein